MEITPSQIEEFLHGTNPDKHIVSIEYDYRTNKVLILKEIPGRGKCYKEDKLVAFCWMSDMGDLQLYDGSREKLRASMAKYGITVEKLLDYGNNRLKAGLNYMVKSQNGYSALRDFFIDGGLDLNNKEIKDRLGNRLLMLPPVEQYLISTGKRFFKGFEDYDDITRLVFDIETTSLNPKDGYITMIGVKTNKGFHQLLNSDNGRNEKRILLEFFSIIDDIKPSIIGGYYSFNFDWDFIFARCEILNLDVKKFWHSINTEYKVTRKEANLKMGGEVETFMQTKLRTYNVIDIIHAVRRAMAINSDIKEAGLKYITKYIKAEDKDRVYIPHEDIGKIYDENKKFWLNPKNGNYRRFEEFPDLEERYPGRYLLIDGQELVSRYLDDDLEETLRVDKEFNQASFLMASMVPTTYERVTTMGTAAIWKLLMLAWSYKHNLAVPRSAKKRNFVGGLSRLLKTGYSKNILKLDFASLYPSIQLAHDIFPECDVTGVMKAMLSYFRDTRIKYKSLASEWYSKDPKIAESYNNKQQPIKIFINSLFGSLSAPLVFQWADIDKGESITCIGRQYLRHMIKFFMEKNYTPLVCDTDGVNFSYPEDVDSREYTGKGSNWKVKKDKVYKGIEADIAQYNDLHMKKEMALDTDGTWASSINLSRKNYAIMTNEGKIKLTGNTIKSKKMPQYIEEFLDNAIKMLLNGDGHSFVEYYYEYLEKIQNKKIPIIKIANKSKVKQTVSDYKVRINNKSKAGHALARMAHMELIINNNIDVNLGDVVYYVNNGKSIADGDVQKKGVPKYDKDTIKRMRKEAKETNRTLTKEDLYEDKIVLNCYFIDKKQLELNPDLLGEYNVNRAISIFNKRILPLLVVFNPIVRENLLVKDVNDKYLFTRSQCELINGLPMESGDQDDLDTDLLQMSKEEIKFWEKMNLSPNFIFD
jgi:DNA polymerase elongation subunit (family B)